MSAELSPHQKKTKAKNKIRNLQLDETLNSLDQKINQLFNDADPVIIEGISREEVKQLIEEINNNTASNNKITKFLNIAGKLGI